MTITSISSLSENMRKVDDNFYTGKIPGKDLCIVMERVNDANIQLWRRYAEIQSNPYVADQASQRCDINGQLFQKGSLIDGSGHFKKILETVPYNLHEVWVAYITKTKTPEKIPDNMAVYSSDNAINGDNAFAKDIEMFVSITSSPEALITSHMGVASSIEGVGNRSRGTSVDLHSFAAKVMLIRKPDRKYMVNAPVDAMEMIFAKTLPGSFYAGTLEMQQKMKKRQLITLETFTNIIMPKKAKKSQECAAVNSDDPRACRAQVLSELSVEKQYHYYKNPYIFKAATNKESQAEEFLQFMEKHPPILSKKNEKMVIYNPLSRSEPDITIEKGNKEYEWMHVHALRPVGSTHYVVIDLQALASSKALDSVSV